MSGKLGSRLLGLLSVVVVLTAWECAVDFGWISKLILASPSMIALQGWEMFFVTGEIYPHIAISLTQAAYGFSLSVVIGVLLGLAMGRFRTIRSLLEPWAMALYSTPTVALFPLLTLWLGLGMGAKVTLIFLSSVFVVLVNTQAGVENANPKLIETARAFTASELTIFFFILLPAAVPFIVAGLRLAIGRVLITVFVAELYAANRGVGFLIVQAGANFDTATLFLGILVLTITGMVLSQALRLVENTLLLRYRAQ
jgi:NitT/TauT family transport system permease protein